jgi:hypothetical protein
MIEHTCDNEVCKLLNPCIDGLLPYSEVVRRVTEVEVSAYFIIKNYKKMNMSIKGPFDLFDWANRHMVYQLPNVEFVRGLSNKIRDIGAKKILEVGAGRGIISRYISEILNNKIILTDSYSWWGNAGRIKHMEYDGILKRTYNEAIEEFEPDLIIASWIPYNECWTKDFRKYPFVEGYILIGEGQGGATGCSEDWDVDWKIQHLKAISDYGISKTDHGFHMEESMLRMLHTDVTYFERPKY